MESDKITMALGVISRAKENSHDSVEEKMAEKLGTISGPDLDRVLDKLAPLVENGNVRVKSLCCTVLGAYGQCADANQRAKAFALVGRLSGERRLHENIALAAGAYGAEALPRVRKLWEDVRQGRRHMHDQGLPYFIAALRCGTEGLSYVLTEFNSLSALNLSGEKYDEELAKDITKLGAGALPILARHLHSRHHTAHLASHLLYEFGSEAYPEVTKVCVAEDTTADGEENEANTDEENSREENTAQRHAVKLMGRLARLDVRAVETLWSLFVSHLLPPDAPAWEDNRWSEDELPLAALILKALHEGAGIESPQKASGDSGPPAQPPVPDVCKYYADEIADRCFACLEAIRSGKYSELLRAPLIRLLAWIGSSEDEGKLFRRLTDSLELKQPQLVAEAADIIGELVFICDETLWHSGLAVARAKIKDLHLTALEWVPKLCELMKDRSEDVRIAAIGAIGKFLLARRRHDGSIPRHHRSIVANLRRKLVTKKTSNREKIACLQALTEAPVVDFLFARDLKTAYQKADEQFRIAIIGAIKECGRNGKNFAPFLISALSESDAIAAAAQEALGKVDPEGQALQAI